MEPNQTLSMTLEGSTTGRSCRHAERKFAEHVKSCLLNLNPDFFGAKTAKKNKESMLELSMTSSGAFLCSGHILDDKK